MSIMGCYQDKCAIENELGGKWELFFEETRDEAGNVGLEWDKDFDDAPLNLNGVLLIISKPITDTAVQRYFDLTINNIENVRCGMANNSPYQRKMTGKAIVKNHMLSEHLYCNSDNKSALLTQQNIIYESVGYDSITSFTVNYPSADIDTTIQIYVLRGV